MYSYSSIIWLNEYKIGFKEEFKLDFLFWEEEDDDDDDEDICFLGVIINHSSIDPKIYAQT